MGIWDSMKASGKKAKLQGDLLLLEREMKTRKMAFGIELYDLLVSDGRQFGGNVLSNNTKVFQLSQTHLSEPFEACKTDIQDILAKQQSHRNEQEVLAASRERGQPASTASEKMARAGQWVSTNAQETKLEAQVKLLDRDIRRRKEMFGLQVYDGYVATGLADPTAHTTGSARNVVGNMKERLSARMSQYSPKEKKIQECLDRTKNAVELLERQHVSKGQEIEELGGTYKKYNESNTSTTGGSASVTEEHKSDALGS